MLDRDFDPASSHSWRLPTIAPLPHSLPSELPSSRANRLLHSKSADAMPPSARRKAKKHIQSAEFQSRVLEAELALRESLQSSGELSRERAAACLSALGELSRLPSAFSGFLPLLHRELTDCLLSERVGGSGRLFFFEALREADESLADAHDTVERLHDAMGQREGERAALEAGCDRMNRKLQLYQQALAEAKAAVNEHARGRQSDALKYTQLLEEHEALGRRMLRVEEVRRAKEELLKEAQVELHIERQRNAEQGMLYSKLEERATSTELELQSTIVHLRAALVAAHGEHYKHLGVVREAKPAASALEDALKWADEIAPGAREAAAAPGALERQATRAHVESPPSSPDS